MFDENNPTEATLDAKSSIWTGNNHIHANGIETKVTKNNAGIILLILLS